MQSIVNRWMVALASASFALLATAPAGHAAGVITSPNGAYEVGINDLGNLYDPNTGIGFRRVADGYDPIAPGTPREAYGIAAGNVSGYADSQFFGNSNLTLVATNFAANSAKIDTVLDDGNGALLLLEQIYSFVGAAQNVLRIDSIITNISGAAIDRVLYSRNVDWDIDPTPFNEVITVDPLGGEVVDSSYFGFENPDPLAPFFFSGGAAGGVFGPGDLGGGMLIDFGPFTALDSRSFSVFQAINQLGQTEAQLRAQLGGAGGHDDINAAAMGYAFGLNAPNPTFLISGVAIPEPASMAMAGLGLIAVAALARSRRRA